MIRGKIKQILVGICVLAIFFGIFPNNTMAATNVAIKTVKVGIFNLGQFMSWNDSDEAVGYNVDYLNKIAETTHWNYEYVHCDNWVDATDKLEAGEIDLLAPAQITDALSERFDYGVLSMGTEAAAIYTKAGRDDLLYEDFDTMAGLKYGCAEGSTFARKFAEEYSVDAGFTPNVRDYANTTELQSALANDEVDAIVTNIMFASDDVKLLGWFSPMRVYYISQKGNQSLLDELDKAMMQIMVEEPAFASNLESEYFPIYDSTRMTYDEMQYVKEVPQLNVGYMVNEKPLSYQDEKTGEFTGICRDILDQISKNTGVEFCYVPLFMEQCTKEYLEENNIHVLANYEYSTDSERSYGTIKCSQPYLSTDQVIVAAEGTTIATDDAVDIAIDQASAQLQEQVQSIYPNAQITLYSDMKECFGAAESKRADVVIGNRYIIDPYLNKPAYNNLKVVQINGVASSLCIASVVFGDEGDELDQLVSDSRLISIIDKGINQIGTNEINTITTKHTSKNIYKYTLGDFAYQYRFFLIVLALTLALIITLLLLNAENKKKAVEEISAKNSQLAYAIDEANNANAAKGQFLAQMSHEIRTPMNAIIGLTTIAKTDIKNPEKMMDFLNKIDGASRILLGIINDVLDMSAIESKKMKIASAEFDFKQLLTSITTVFYQQCKQKGISFEMRMKGVTEEVLVGDALRVNQIMMNLLSNAVKFTPPGGEISVLVIQGSSSKNMVHLRFIVSDTGCGMSEELQKRLFSPFEQEDATTARKYGGSGLGLSITKNLIEMMNGSIQVESEKEKGTIFTVDIPFEMTGKNIDEKEDDGFTDIRALIVDDDEDSCKYTGIIMERLGVAYDYATNGESALDMLGEAEDNDKPYNICFVDWKMPDMDGIAVTQKIRDVFGDDTIVIIISAYDLNEVEADARKAGADYFIPKPLFQSTIFNILMKISHKSYDKVEAAQENSGKYNFTGKKVLIAEDVALNMEVAVDLLKMVGIESVCAEDGVQAVSIYERSDPGEFDAILLDINMPNKDGYVTAMEIRSSLKEDAKTVPIYAMTANAFTEDVTRALNAGMDGHIAKPIETDVLYKTLEKAFSERK